MNHLLLPPLAAACLGLLLPAAWAQHGVIREYAALAPQPDAVPGFVPVDVKDTGDDMLISPGDQ